MNIEKRSWCLSMASVAVATNVGATALLELDSVLADNDKVTYELLAVELAAAVVDHLMENKDVN